MPPSVTERNGFVKVVFPRVNPSLRKSADLTAKSPNKITAKSPNKITKKPVKGGVSASRTTAKSPNKNAAKSPNKTRGKNRAIKALSEILPMGMRADARRSLLAVFKEVYLNSEVTIKQVDLKD